MKGKKIEIDPNSTDGDLVLTAAMRYAMGRQTYIVAVIADLLIKAAPMMRSQSRIAYAAEIRHELSAGRGGMDCDKEDWRRVIRAMES